ncbi:glycosyltransferase [Aeromonas sp. 95A]|uniref:glycosyltransferase n=1 Tax=Aeromonas sp. 95A TaxID=3452729 RepID=UPI003F796526
MRALFFINETIKESSGISKKILSQVSALASMSETCYFCRLVESDGYFSRQVDDYLLNEFGAGKLGRLKSWLQFYNLEQFILKNGVTFLYIRYTHYANPLFNIFLKRIKSAGVRVIMEIPTFPYDHEYDQACLFSRLKLKLEQVFRQTMANHVYRFVTFSNDKEIWGRPAICISNAVNPDLLPISTSTFNGLQLNFIAVANLAPWHGYDRFLRSLAHYYTGPNKPTCDIHFHLVGDGPLLSDLVALAKQLDITSRVTFHGPLDGENLDKVFANAHIGVDSLGRHRSGNNYNNSLKSKEYLIRGLPIIKSHIDSSIDINNYCYQISANEEVFSLSELFCWFTSINSSHTTIRTYATQKFTWVVQMGHILKNVNMQRL